MNLSLILHDLKQSYSISFNKGQFAEIPDLPRSVHSGEKLQTQYRKYGSKYNTYYAKQ